MVTKWMMHDTEHATVVTVEKPGRAIANFNSGNFADEENEQHARKAIQAVNNHEDLVLALRRALDIIKKHAPTAAMWVSPELLED